MAEPALRAPAAVLRAGWPRRFTVVALFFLATMLCYVDRVSIGVAIIPLAREMGYDSAAQGFVLSAFFWGYMWPQLAGGILADRFGGRRVLAAGVAIWSLATFMTPAAAKISFELLLAVRVLLGLGEGVNFPAIHSLAARWTPAGERARVIALNFSGMHLGTVIAFVLSPPIIIAFGWPALFYLSGIAGAVWVAAWMLKAADRPEDVRDLSPDELETITAGRGAEARARRVPWLRIAREPAVWAIVLAHFCSNFGFNILLLWLPTYLNHTFGVRLERVGALSLVPWIATFAVINAGGFAADAMLRRGVRAGTVRKLMQTSAFALGALPLLALPAARSPWNAVTLVALSAAASGLGNSGFGVNHLDVGPTYAGVLMGISNTIATIPGIVGVAAAGFIVQATSSFAAVFYLIAAVYAAGLVGYLAWASGEQRI
jgi:MFS transporter, ACS family, solute carrier family 17 (sodium-dependent inorganic phosphate cotransporter), other